MSKKKAAAIRALKTTVQALIASLSVTALTKNDVRIALVTSFGAGVLSLINSALTTLPEEEGRPDDSVTPDIPDEEVIDTSTEDDELNGGGLNE